ncbi:Serine/threonine-protein kinase ATR [Entamoeba marina]
MICKKSSQPDSFEFSECTLASRCLFNIFDTLSCAEEPSVKLFLKSIPKSFIAQVAVVVNDEKRAIISLDDLVLERDKAYEQDEKKKKESDSYKDYVPRKSSVKINVETKNLLSEIESVGRNCIAIGNLEKSIYQKIEQFHRRDNDELIADVRNVFKTQQDFNLGRLIEQIKEAIQNSQERLENNDYKQLASLSEKFGKTLETNYWTQRSLKYIDQKQTAMEIDNTLNEKINNDHKSSILCGERGVRQYIRLKLKDQNYEQNLSFNDIPNETKSDKNVYENCWKIIVQSVFDKNNLKYVSPQSPLFIKCTERFIKEIKISYTHAYDSFKLLHILYDINYFHCNYANSIDSLESVMTYLTKRSERIAKSLFDKETLLLIHAALAFSCIHKLKFHIAKFEEKEGKFNRKCSKLISSKFLELAKLSFKDRFFDKAINYCDMADSFKPYSSVCIRNIIDFQQHSSWEPIKYLKTIYSSLMLKKFKPRSLYMKKICLTVAQLTLERSGAADEITKYFYYALDGQFEEGGKKKNKSGTSYSIQTKPINDPFDIEIKTRNDPFHMKANFLFAKYRDDSLAPVFNLQQNNEPKNQHTTTQTSTTYLSTAYTALKHYFYSLCDGHKYVYQIIPRILTILRNFSFSKEFVDEKTNVKIEHKQVLTFVSDCVKVLPVYLWYPFVPQIISWLGPNNAQNKNIFNEILSKVLDKYPHQTLWHLMSSLLSKDSQRSSTFKGYISKSREDIRKLSDNMIKFCNALIQLAEYNPQVKVDYLVLKNTTEPSLFKLWSQLCQKDWSDIMLPQQSSLTANIPPYHSDQFLSIFPNKQIMIGKINTRLKVFPSLQKPKRIAIVGKDKLTGKIDKEYYFLCKGGDDVRKDKRMMEVCSLINKLLLQTHESLACDLHINTYSVIPLNETSGLLEWVANTSTIKSVIFNHIDHKAQPIFSKKLESSIPADKRINNFVQILNDKRSQPYLGSWFQHHFKIPNVLLEARVNYIKTLAVMSIVGYVFGMGDRHLENILINTENGEVVHVDFDILFWKGKALSVPECVPFRLTQNIIDAMGASEEKGMFTEMCTIVLKVLRHNKGLLLSVVKSFIDDPFVDWSKKTKFENHIFGNPKECIRKIQSILSGSDTGNKVDERTQAEEVISEAMSPNNLGLMYNGWAPWM